ncbi:MAG: hypothetical protein AB7R69_04725 [Candidatus Babeliales bacterium]
MDYTTTIDTQQQLFLLRIKIRSFFDGQYAAIDQFIQKSDEIIKDFQLFLNDKN